MTDQKEKLFLIEKRGLYYRPGARGYTSQKRHAGRYTLAQVAKMFPNFDSPNQDGMQHISEADAPALSKSCSPEVRLLERAEAAEAERDALRKSIIDVHAACLEWQNNRCIGLEIELKKAKALSAAIHAEKNSLGPDPSAPVEESEGTKALSYDPWNNEHGIDDAPAAPKGGDA